MAGVPRDHAVDVRRGWRRTLEGGAPIESRAVHVMGLREGIIAEGLGAVQARYPDVDIGSYPFYRASGNGVAMVAKGTNVAMIEAAISEVRAADPEPRRHRHSRRAGTAMSTCLHDHSRWGEATGSEPPTSSPPEKRLAALRSIRDGRLYDLSHETGPNAPFMVPNQTPFLLSIWASWRDSIRRRRAAGAPMTPDRTWSGSR